MSESARRRRLFVCGRFGTSRVSVNQQLGAWKSQGLVSVDKSIVTLLDPTRIEEIATGAAS